VSILVRKDAPDVFLAAVYHVVWSTEKREPLITPSAEPVIQDFLQAKATALGGNVFAINGTADHVHMVVSIPPTIAVATFIGQVKGVASAKYNKRRRDADGRFSWQAQYGVFSFDGKRLSNIIAYVDRQKEHHAEGTTIPVLERYDGESVKMIR
jgi:putative transposase